MNHYKTFGRGKHYVKEEAKIFKNILGINASQVMRFQGLSKLLCDVSVEIIWHCKKKGRGDLDNKLKCILDALSGICYNDDKQVKHIDIRKKEQCGYDGITVEVNEF